MTNDSSQGKPRIGLVGYGYWGPNLLRNLVANEGCQAIGVVDARPEACKRASSLYPHIATSQDLDAFLREHRPDGMVIATPPATHRDVAIKCLRAGAHVLIEKPLALSTAESDEILAVAEAMGKKVMVDHTFIYNPAVEYLLEKNSRGDFGELHYYDSVRVNLGGFQPQTNALWDLAPHDLSIIDRLIGGQLPKSLTATGIRHFGTQVENLCYLHLNYANNFVAHLHLNWVAPVKIRTVMLSGSKKMAVYDENLPTEKVKLYDKGVSITGSERQSETTRSGQGQGLSDFRVHYRTGDMTAPALSAREALAGMTADFVKMITDGTTSRSDGESGKRVVQILEAASISMANGGQLTHLEEAAAIARRSRIARVA